MWRKSTKDVNKAEGGPEDEQKGEKQKDKKKKEKEEGEKKDKKKKEKDEGEKKKDKDSPAVCIAVIRRVVVVARYRL